jgi:hypothetical protein
MKNTFSILKDLYATFPQNMIEDFAVDKAINGGVNYEAIEDHLQMVHNATDKQIEEVRLFLHERNKKEYSLCEAVADISFLAGRADYYDGDSRTDIAMFISWAKEFEKKFLGVDWGFELDYIEEIQNFTDEKMKGGKFLV